MTGAFASIPPQCVRQILERHVLVDGFDFILDLQQSSGSWIIDAATGKAYLDLFTFYSSSALGLNPPQLVNDSEFMRRLATAAVNKPSNSDSYSAEYAEFVMTFSRVLGDPELPHLFFIDGGALAVENALKAAFDWKSQRMGASSDSDVPDLAVLHLEKAFHGRSGYTLSLTNTELLKTAWYPKFAWPRIPAPALKFPLKANACTNRANERHALQAARTAFDAAKGKIACFIAEPIQGEGGDNHLSATFLNAMQELCFTHDCLFVLDEVQTGCGITGTAWAYQQFDLKPDLVAFGKKTHICGVMAGRRIKEIPDNVFQISSRVSSTWGGSLVDMVRAARILQVIEQDNLFDAATQRGEFLLRGLVALASRFAQVLHNPRGRGLMCAVDLPNRRARDDILQRLYRNERVIALPCGDVGLRFRPSLTITEEQIEIALQSLRRCLEHVS
jgi:L-lysine 6-transaminase